MFFSYITLCFSYITLCFSYTTLGFSYTSYLYIVSTIVSEKSRNIFNIFKIGKIFKIFFRAYPNIGSFPYISRHWQLSPSMRIRCLYRPLIRRPAAYYVRTLLTGLQSMASPSQSSSSASDDEARSRQLLHNQLRLLWHRLPGDRHVSVTF